MNITDFSAEELRIIADIEDLLEAISTTERIKFILAAIQKRTCPEED